MGRCTDGALYQWGATHTREGGAALYIQEGEVRRCDRIAELHVDHRGWIAELHVNHRGWTDPQLASRHTERRAVAFWAQRRPRVAAA